MSVIFVVNPHSAGGRTRSRLPELERLAGQTFEDSQIVLTQSVGDGIRLARDAADSGAELVIAVGGDGTASEVVSGLTAVGGRTEFAVLPAGTGSDLVRTLKVPSDWRKALPAIRDAPARDADVMAVRCHDKYGLIERFGVNVVGFGMAGDVVARTNRSSKRLGGKLTFLLHTVRSAIAWSSPEVQLTWRDEFDREGRWSGPLMNVFLCNGSYCGGGMWVGPDADLCDGLLDMVVIPKAPLATAALRSRHLYSGKISQIPEVVTARVKWLRAESDVLTRVPVDVDGEAVGYSTLEVDCRASVLRLRSLSV